MTTEHKKTLRLGLVGPLPPPNGGMAMQTQQLGSLLAEEGVDVHFVQTNAPYSPAFIVHLPIIRALFRLIPYIFRVWALAGRVEVIHLMANSGWSWQLFSAPVIWVGWMRNTPVIVNYRGGGAGEYFQKSFSRIKPSLKKAYGIAVPSTFLGEVFAGCGFSTVTIPNIVNLDRFRPRSPQHHSENYTLIVTRNLESIYAIDTAIHTVDLLKSTIPNIRMLIAGSGPQENELKGLVTELGLDGIVQFVGRLGRDEIIDFYQNADVMLNPSSVDNMPNSILESMASGVPVVSTNVGGIPYMVDDEVTALLVAPANPEAMASAVRRLYNSHGLTHEISCAGIKEVQKYSWSAIKDLWLKMYFDAAGSVNTRQMENTW